jgi:exodeoxyribonuclease V alpha subunit
MSAAVEPKTETIRGAVRRKRFHNADNGFCILIVELAEKVPPKDDVFDDTFGSSNPLITCKGFLPAIRTDEEYEFVGIWVDDPKWGRQFQFSKAEVILPATTEGAARYLASVAAGVGPATAGKIIAALGGEGGDNANILQAIIEEPEKLYKLDFLKQEQADDIVTALTENAALAELSAMICRDGIGPATAARIYAQYGKAAVEKVRENPYIIADDVFGIGYKKADVIARGMGVPVDSPYRIEAAYSYMLQEATNEGHVFLGPNDTIPRLKDLLDGRVEIPLVAAACKSLQDKGKVVREQTEDGKSAIYDADLHRAETELAGYIRRLVTSAASETWEPWPPGIEGLILGQEREMQIEYAPEQKAAIAVALQNPLSVITGGPGVGKTTVIKTICNLYAGMHRMRPIYLSAPTGKAAKRMSEATGREAKTIHRLLRFNPQNGFEFCKENPLPGPGLLIIDEVSMMDVELAADLFAAIDIGMTVVLVGDIDQLPSVGPGSVLRDVIDSGVVPVVRLRFNYRQAGGSKIAEYAHWIVGGRVPPIVAQDGDYECRNCETPEEVLEWVRFMVKDALAAGMSPMDFQVMAPMRRGSIGVEALNEMVRDLCNPPADAAGEIKPEYGRGKMSFRLGDKLIVIKNDYDLGVFNGDMGIVADVRYDGIVVDVDGWEVFFKGENLKKLQHAYAITIHKSQGSEWPLAIVVCHTQSYIMLQKNLLYTSITRAKNRLVLLTNSRALKQAVTNDKQTERLSLLKERLRARQ